MKKTFLTVAVFIAFVLFCSQTTIRVSTSSSTSAKTIYTKSGSDEQINIVKNSVTALRNSVYDTFKKYTVRFANIDASVLSLKMNDAQQDIYITALQNSMQDVQYNQAALNDTLTKMAAALLLINNTVSTLNNTVTQLTGRVSILEQANNIKTTQISALYDSISKHTIANSLQDKIIKANTDSINKILAWNIYYKEPLILIGPNKDTVWLDKTKLKAFIQ